MIKYTHKLGALYTSNGSILSRTDPSIMLDENIAVCIAVDNDENTISLMKYGNYDSVSSYYKNSIKKLIDSGLEELASEWKLLTFNTAYPELCFAPDGYNFTIDEICTLLNYWCNVSLTSADILLMSVDDAKHKIKSLADFGY